MKKIDIGSEVTLKDEVWQEEPGTCRQATTVVGFLSDVKGGVILAERLMGFRTWNVQDLRPYRRGEAWKSKPK